MRYAFRSKAGRRGARALAALAALVTGGCSPADLLNAVDGSGGYTVTRSVAYGDHPRQTLDVYVPDGDGRKPVVVFFYGGSWQQGAKETYTFAAAALARRGYLTIVPDYRVYPDVHYPGFIEDGARVLRWVKDRAADHRGDAGRLFVMGHSAGAYIAAMLAIDGRWLQSVQLKSADIAGLIGISGPYDFLPLRDPVLVKIFHGDNEVATQPITYVTPGAPPALLIHGAGDTTVDPGNASRLAARLRASGNEANVIRYDRVGHIATMGAFAPMLRFLAPVLNDAVNFMDARTLQLKAARAAGDRS